jgi:hypothetical protein
MRIMHQGKSHRVCPGVSDGEAASHCAALFGHWAAARTDIHDVPVIDVHFFTARATHSLQLPE